MNDAKFTPTEIVQKVLEDHLFTVNRGLREYLRYFGPEFHDDLINLNASQHWIDCGSGEARAQKEYLAGQVLLDATAPATRVQTTAVSYKYTPQNDDPLRLKILSGRMFEDIPKSELGKADLITDVVGVLNYTCHLDFVLNQYLQILAPQGKIYVFLPVLITWIKPADDELIELQSWLSRNSSLYIREVPNSDPREFNRSAFIIEKRTENAQIPKLQLISAAHQHAVIRTFSTVEP